MIARIAYLTSPAPNRFMLNFQSGDDDLITVEISKAHLANILITGTDFALREHVNTAFKSSNRVSETTNESAEHDRAKAWR